MTACHRSFLASNRRIILLIFLLFELKSCKYGYLYVNLHTITQKKLPNLFDNNEEERLIRN